MEFRELLDLSNHYLEKKINGSDYKDIRQELLRKNFSEEDINKIIHRVQRMELRHIKKKDSNTGFLNQAAGGLIIMLIGLGVTLFTFFSGSTHYILAYGAIASGAGVMIYGLTRYRK
ncbi:hypothetical protein GWK08_07845 [Leptobacterium flavescens]|uniref:Uncharacterized protein n=1 Tax=Leptobacterium flavescens TaxID=472055 RepID=A0A6P0USK7_9FLAO|nr:hypothetical protein [Leptobacterium flavescens]NER13346.1 hypothetical protein [Leptobacterium flavescens]